MQETFEIDKKTIDALWRLQKLILDTPDFESVVSRIVNAILKELGYLKLGYRILVLTLIDHEKHVLKRITLSQTNEAMNALEASPIPFGQIEIPLSAEDNLLIKTLAEKKVYVTHYWPDIFHPVLSDEAALGNQNAAGIKTSLLYPLIVKEQAIGVMIFSLVKSETEVTQEEKELISRFTDIAALAVQNSRLYSSLKGAKDNLEKINRRLIELDKLKNEFVSVASHELRTPMTAIKSYLWMVLAGKGGELTEKQRYYAQRAYNSVDRLIKLVNDMLNISRIESGRLTITMQEVDLRKLAQDVIDECMPRANELALHLILESPQTVPTVVADPDKIKEVLFNLIGNSLKFTGRGGTIIVSLSQKDDMVETQVRDTGVGIDKEDMPKLFQKFGLLPGSYVTNQPTMGTGLGLYICKSILDLHKGKIWAASEGRGKGTTFTFSLKVFNREEMEKLNSLYEKNSQEHIGLIHTQF